LAPLRPVVVMGAPSVDLAALKIVVGIALAAASFAGTMLPRFANQLDPTSVAKWLPIANCFSAGLLFGAGLLHFFAEAVSVMADKSGDCGENASTALSTGLHWLAGGFFLSLTIDRILLRSSALSAAAAHGHSHDVGLERHSTSSEDTPTKPKATSVATVIVAVLLGVHAAFEGTSLAFETTASSLRAGFVPLLIHKFFDGFLLGIQTVREEIARRRREAEEEVPTSPVRKTQCWGMNTTFLMAVCGWSCITPVVLIAVVACGAGKPSMSGSLIGPSVQCLGAGTFLYICVMEILASEFSGRRRHPSLSTEPSNVAKIGAVLCGIVLVKLLNSGHHHH